jgi:hypothetical protein
MDQKKMTEVHTNVKLIEAPKPVPTQKIKSNKMSTQKIKP